MENVDSLLCLLVKLFNFGSKSLLETNERVVYQLKTLVCMSNIVLSAIF